ncbi:hypothetical protein [Streptomyces hydrogenans]|uniref:hypothetical protein n=1 Tax=Streptomyces hydrogenans TaxID=1873719 RepID=UPI00382EC851
MPAYLVQHPAAQAREDILIEDAHLELAFHGGWAVFTDHDGVCLAIPTGQGACIRRIDPEEEQQPAPSKE